MLERKYPLLHIAAGLLVLVAAMNAVANYFSLYWSLWWLDVVMHTAGGAAVALALVWFVFHSGYVPAPPRTQGIVFLIALLGTFAVGVLWEGYEYVFGAITTYNYPLDTLLDIAADIAGALIGFLCIVRYDTSHA